jgi:short-subunit dehydrogenase
MTDGAVSPASPWVFITGASSGIGQALALAYYQRGWGVALVARRQDLLADWAQAQGWDPARHVVCGADVTQADEMVVAARHAMAALGGLPEVVIANAGISLGMDTAHRDDLTAFQEVLGTNVLGLATTFHPFLAGMRRARRGTLVVMASVAAIRGLPGHGAYCASKAAAVAYAESLRGECRRFGVRVLTLLPGYVATPLTARNPYRMPFLTSPQALAEQAIRAIDAGATERVIPWQMAWVAAALKVLPNAWFDRLFARRAYKPRRDRA